MHSIEGPLRVEELWGSIQGLPCRMLWKMRFTSSVADPDMWLHMTTKADGEEYYECIVCYVDDAFSVSANTIEL